MKSIRLKANAKLNLYLDITGKRSDGYHTLRTVMQTIDLYDELEFFLSDGTGIEIFCDVSGISSGRDNLVYKGITAMMNYCSFAPGCKITVNLKKHIPSGAGMGGGSSDCAAAIIAVNELFHLGLSSDEMRTAAAMCGADVPFLIEGGTALCEGTGEQISPLEPVKDIWFAVVKPDDFISTPSAYRLYDEKADGLTKKSYSVFESSLSDGINSLGTALYNAFTEVCAPESVISAIEALKANGAHGAEMTGSGSAAFGVFDDRKKALRAAKACGLNFYGAFRPTESAVEILR